MMAEAFIVDAVRSPTGKRRGSLQDVHAADLGAHVLSRLLNEIRFRMRNMMMSFSEQ